MVNFEKEEQQKSLERVKRAIAITSSDTLSSVHMKERVIWIASGSWLERQTVAVLAIPIMVIGIAFADRDC